jgi:NAD(P) transhydrogenase subunit alpha
MMKLGVIKETKAGETRVAITPDVVKTLVKKGLQVMVQSGAGEAAHFSDAAYVDAGADIADIETVLACDVIAKVRKPSLDEIAKMSAGAVYIGQVESCGEDDSIAAMQARDIKVIALERVPRISRAQSMDVLSSQANIAGYRAVLEAAGHYGRFLPLMMTSAGSAKPAKVVILGVGVAGLQAIATARRLGADVYAYDIRPETKEQIESLGAKAIELDIGESGSGEGGYAKELSDEGKAKQQRMLVEELSKAHVIITTAQIPCREAPELVTEEVVQNLREGSVIVDMAAGSGGNCRLSKPDQVAEAHGVLLVGHTNYPAMMPTDASAFYAKNVANLLDIMLEPGEEGLVLKDLDADEITAAAQVKPVAEK